MIVRRLAALVCALLVGVQVIRGASAAALAELRPDAAARLWAGHPDVEISRGLTDIARAARSHTAIAPEVFKSIDDAAVKAPLSEGPYLVRGVQAQTAGDLDSARFAFEAAQWRQPRSPAAAYFLADYYFRTRRIAPGLAQVALLARLSPNGNQVVAPFVASYARDSANWPQIRAALRSQPNLQDEVLAALARNAANTDAVLALADGTNKRSDAPWLKLLLQTLVNAGDYGRARAVWASVGGAREDGSLLYDPGFSNPTAPPPFNWSLGTSNVGLAERQPGGGLHLIFYGNNDGALAAQLLTLPAGSYRLQMRFAASPVHAETLRWSVRCDKATAPVSSVPIQQAAGAGWSFTVPQNCPAQWLELGGSSGDVAQQAEATITGLTLTRGGGNV